MPKMLKGDTDTDTDTLISEISTDTYTDTFQVQNFDTDTILLDNSIVILIPIR